MANLTAVERLIRAKVKMLKDSAFYGVILMYMRMFPLKGMGTMGVDKLGDLYYSEKFIKTLSDEELKGTIEHEILHVMFGHIQQPVTRVKNIAQDIKINDILLEDQIVLPKCVIRPHNHSVTVGGITIEDIKNKSSRMIEEELRSKLTKKPEGSEGSEGSEDSEGSEGSGSGDSEGSDGSDGSDGSGSEGSEGDSEGSEGFDSHNLHGKIGPEGKEGDSPVIGENGEFSKKWKDILTEAKTSSRGNLPGGVKKILEGLFEPKINWYDALEEYISKSIVTDSTWLPPSRRALASGIYMPGVVKESIKVLCHVDSSGSMAESIPKFLSELDGILSSFSIECKVIVGDTQLCEEFDLDNYSEASEVEVSGFGGTSHQWMVNYLNKADDEYDVVISLTDGDSDIESVCQDLEQPFIIVLDEERNQATLEPYADMVLVMPE